MTPIWQAVNDFLQQWRHYLRHLPTCSADEFIGQGCNCGLRARVERLLNEVAAEPPAASTETNQMTKITHEIDIKGRDLATGCSGTVKGELRIEANVAVLAEQVQALLRKCERDVYELLTGETPMNRKD